MMLQTMKIRPSPFYLPRGPEISLPPLVGYLDRVTGMHSHFHVIARWLAGVLTSPLSPNLDAWERRGKKKDVNDDWRVVNKG